jgi:hypothetical protein
VQCVLLLLSVCAAPSSALAASDIQLKHAADGTLVVVGSGWHRGQELVISLGQSRFDVRADGSGDFELDTHLASFQGELGIHHPDQAALGFIPLSGAQPNALAVLFAQTVVEGAILVGLLAAAGLLGIGFLSLWRAPRYPRR